LSQNGPLLRALASISVASGPSSSSASARQTWVRCSSAMPAMRSRSSAREQGLSTRARPCSCACSSAASIRGSRRLRSSGRPSMRSPKASNWMRCEGLSAAGAAATREAAEAAEAAEAVIGGAFCAGRFAGVTASA
jgi:hypothetical protein